VSDTSGWSKAMSVGGLSKARLSRLTEVMGGYVERGEVPGVVTLVARHGEVHVAVIGVPDLRPDDAGRRKGRRRTCPVQAIGRDHDNRSAHPRAEGNLWILPRLLRQPWLGIRPVRRHQT
jgi:hypothetical protein